VRLQLGFDHDRIVVEAEDARHPPHAVLDQPDMEEPCPAVQAVAFALVEDVEDVLAGEDGAVHRVTLLQRQEPDCTGDRLAAEMGFWEEAPLARPFRIRPSLSIIVLKVLDKYPVEVYTRAFNQRSSDGRVLERIRPGVY
jgi:hypothetical protein